MRDLSRGRPFIKGNVPHNKGVYSNSINGFQADEVKRLYWDRGFSLPKIEKLVGRTNASIFQFMKHNGIPTRNRYASNARRKPKVEMKCAVCGVSKLLLRSAIMRGQGKFCSVECKAKFQRGKVPWNKGKKWPPVILEKLRRAKHRRPTGPEVRFIEIISTYGIPLRYTGNGTFWLDHINPDFVNSDKRIAVEIYGDYWHSPLYNPGAGWKALLSKRKTEFEKRGWTPIFIWESEINSKGAKELIFRRLKTVGLL